MEAGYFAIFWLLIGRPLNAVIDRLLPHDYVDGVIAKGAHTRPLQWWEWLPILSAVGAAKTRRVPFPNLWVRYPIVELTTAALFGLTWYRLSQLNLQIWLILISLAFIATLITLAFIDFETTYLPDALVLPLLTVAIVVSFLVPDREWWQGLAGARLDMRGFYPFAWIGDRLNRPVMGWGDVKLAAALGAILGLAPLGLGLYIGVIIGGAVAIVVYAARLIGFNRILIPYGPYLVASGIISMLYFRSIPDWISGQL